MENQFKKWLIKQKNKFERRLITMRLKVPKEIKRAINDCNLSFMDYIKYDLEGKIPISCLGKNDRIVIEKVGLKKVGRVDWDLLIRNPQLDEPYYKESISAQYEYPNGFRVLDELYSTANCGLVFNAYEDLDMFAKMLYRSIAPYLSLEEYPPIMREEYKNCFFDIQQASDDETRAVMEKFNQADMTLEEVISNWDLLKDKDLSRWERKTNRKRDISHHSSDGWVNVSHLKKAMNQCGDLIQLLYPWEQSKLITEIGLAKDENAVNACITNFANSILENDNGCGKEHKYKILFKHSSYSVGTLLQKRLGNDAYIQALGDKLDKLDIEYVLNSELIRSIFIGVSFDIKYYGKVKSEKIILFTDFLENILDFNDKNNNYFEEEDKSISDLSRKLNSLGHINEVPYGIKINMWNFFKGRDRKYTQQEFNNFMRDYVMMYFPEFRPGKDSKGQFREENPNWFLSENVPEEIQNKFYNHEMSPNDFIDNPNLIDLFGATNIVLGFSNYQWVFPLFANLDDFKLANSYRLEVIKAFRNINDEQLKEAFKLWIGKDFDKVNVTHIKHIVELLNRSSKFEIFSRYVSDIPKDNLDEIYNYLFGIYNHTYYSWVVKLRNEGTLKTPMEMFEVISMYGGLENSDIAETFKAFILKNVSNFDMKKIRYAAEVLRKLTLTNSKDLYSLRISLAEQLLETDNPMEKLDKIEAIFIKNNIPIFGKMFICFQILYPDFSKFNLDDNYSTISPELKEQSLGNVRFGKTLNEKRFNIIYNDLLRISYRSNNRDFMKYLQNLEVGNDIYYTISQNDFDISKLNEEEKKVLGIFANHLQALLEFVVKDTSELEALDKCSLADKIKVLGSLFRISERHDLKDRIVRSFCYSAGIKSFAELKLLAESVTKDADARGRRYARELASGIPFKFEKGDFVRGIGNYEVLSKSINSGNYSKEYLSLYTGENTSDSTALDVDVSMITQTDDIYTAIQNTVTGFGYGNVYVVFKKDNPNFYITRDENYELTTEEYNPQKSELFHTASSGHWGIRTGFAFSDVDYILYKKQQNINSDSPYDANGNVNYVEQANDFDDLPAIKFEIARNGYYIPVIDFSGKLIFTPEEFDKLRARMSGLSYYGENSYAFSDNLLTTATEQLSSQIESSNTEVQTKRDKINQAIKKSLEELGLHLKTAIDGDLTNGFVELIDTGSTGRGTNKPGDGDFDFMMRLDREILASSTKMSELRSTLLRNLGKENTAEQTANGDFRLKGVQLDGISVDIDISFTRKTDKISYSTDEALSDRLRTIKNSDPEKYKQVIANIILAKQVLKEGEAYKPNRGEVPQGGLGGVGIENWILQNGGSFIDAANDFLTHAEGKSFEEFKSIYQIWDFGENHLSERKARYLHDNFVANNMSEAGYTKMVQILRGYLNNLNNTKGATFRHS